MAVRSTDTTAVEATVRRLSAVSARRVIEPDTDLPGELGIGRVLPDELLSVAGLDLDLTAEQRARLSREEVAALLEEGIRFEALLTAGFTLQLSKVTDFSDARITYLLHELGEETRHSRMFIRLLEQLRPTARNPFERGVLGWVKHGTIRAALEHKALFCVLVLAGEEIPDLIQKQFAEHPGTDPFLGRVNRYHRQEEARHLGFARLLLPEVWSHAPHWERWAIHHVAPVLIEFMFDGLVHPGVYRVVGLPGWKTWWAAKHSPVRLRLRHESTRPVLATLARAGAFRRGRAPRRWRVLAGVGPGPLRDAA